MPNRVTTQPRPQVRHQPAHHAHHPAHPARPANWQRTATGATAARDGFAAPRKQINTGNPQLDRIANARLGNGKDHSCVATVRANLRKLGFEGLPPSTGRDNNNPRGMMVQMLQSDHWQSANIPGSKPTTITSPYGKVQANVLSREDYLKAAANGQIPQGAVVFQTKHGWDYNGGSRGNDVGIVQGDHVHNYKDMPHLTVYGAETRDVVILTPS